MHSSRPMILLAGLLATTVAPADTLLEVYGKAVDADPRVREADANRLATREGRPQALAALLPQVTGSVGRNWTKNEGETIGVFAGGAFTNTFLIDNRNDQQTWDLQLTQSLLRLDQWFRLDQSGKQAAQAEFDYTAARQDLIIRVANAYFNVLAAEDTLLAEQANKEAIGQQLEQSRKRFDVGLIAITDVQEAQAAYDSAVALEITAKRNLANQREVLRAIINDYPEILAKPGAEIPLVPPQPADVTEWVDQALKQNATVLSSQVGAEIAKADVRIAQSAFAPSLDLVASRGNSDQDGFTRNYVYPGGFQNPPDLSLPRIQNPTATDSDQDQISLQLSMPLFTGGANTSRVKQAVYRHRAARERLEGSVRESSRQTRDAYLGVITDVARVQSLQQARESARTALKATEAGFEVGTRTTVDVLLARRTLVTAETNYLRSRYDYLIDGLRLKQAAGTLTDSDLQRVDALLQATEKLGGREAKSQPASPAAPTTP